MKHKSGGKIIYKQQSLRNGVRPHQPGENKGLSKIKSRYSECSADCTVLSSSPSYCPEPGWEPEAAACTLFALSAVPAGTAAGCSVWSHDGNVPPQQMTPRFSSQTSCQQAIKFSQLARSGLIRTNAWEILSSKLLPQSNRAFCPDLGWNCSRNYFQHHCSAEFYKAKYSVPDAPLKVFCWLLLPHLYLFSKALHVFSPGTGSKQSTASQEMKLVFVIPRWLSLWGWCWRHFVSF